MKAPTLFALLAVAVVASLATFLVASADTDMPPDPVASLEVEDEDPADDEVGAGEDLVADGPAGPDEPQDESDDGPGGADEGEREAVTSTANLAVRVLRAGTEQVCAGATVASLDYSEYQKLVAKLSGNAKRMPLVIKKHGVRSRANAAGVARVVVSEAPTKSSQIRSLSSSRLRVGRLSAPVNTWVGIAAWTDTLFHCKWVKIADLKKLKKPMDFTIDEDKTLVVKVLGPTSQPLPDFPLRFYRLRPKKSATRDSVYSTASDGRLVLEHWQTMHRSKTQRWVVFPEVVYREPNSIVLSTEELQKEYTLRVGATGSMQFTVKAREGHIVREPGSLSLRSTTVSPTIEGSKLSLPSLSAKIEEGVAKFERVGLGLRFTPSVRIGRNYRDKGSLEYPGPMRSGELVRHELRLGKPGVSVRGVLALANDVVPAAGTSLMLRSSGTNGKQHTETVKLREGGQFSVFLPFVTSGVHRYVFRATIDKVKYEHVKDVSIGGAGVTLDVGRVVLSPPGTIVSGIVVNASGKPIRHARVTLVERVRNASTGKDRFVATHVSTVYTSTDGTFALSGHSMRGRFDVRVNANSYKQVYRPVRIGESEIEVRLQQLGTISFAASFKRGSVSRVRFRARNTKTRRSSSSRVRVSSKKETRFALRNLEPGVYDLTLEVDDWPAPLWARRGFVVRPGPNKIEEVPDFRTTIKRYTFVGETASGALDKSLRARILVDVPVPGKQATAKTFQLRGGRVVSFVCPLPAVRWRAHLPGAPVVEGTASPGATRIRFVPQREITFSLPGVGASIASVKGAWATLKFSRAAPSGLAAVVGGSGQHKGFDAQVHVRAATVSRDRVTHAFEDPSASYRLSLELHVRGARRSRMPRTNIVNSIQLSGMRWGNYRPTFRAKPIELGELQPARLPAGREHRVDVPAAALQAALEELRKKLAETAR